MRRFLTSSVILAALAMSGCVSTMTQSDNMLPERVSSLERVVHGTGGGAGRSIGDRLSRLESVRNSQLGLEREIQDLKKAQASSEQAASQMRRDLDRLMQQMAKVEDSAGGVASGLADDMREFHQTRQGLERQIRELSEKNQQTEARLSQMNSTVADRIAKLDREISGIYDEILGVIDAGATAPGGASPMRGTTYVIQKGDVLATVARRAGVSLRALLAANPDIKNPNDIRIGQKVKIP